MNMFVERLLSECAGYNSIGEINKIYEAFQRSFFIRGYVRLFFSIFLL